MGYLVPGILQDARPLEKNKSGHGVMLSDTLNARCQVSPTRRRIQAPSLTAGHRERSRTRAGADARSVTFSRCPTRDIPGIVEGKPTDSVNSRPEAHGAARMALESVLQEVSPHKAEYEAEMSVARRSRALPAGSRKGGASHVDPRKVDEMRQAIQGAVRILAGISGWVLARKSLASAEHRRCGRAFFIRDAACTIPSPGDFAVCDDWSWLAFKTHGWPSL